MAKPLLDTIDTTQTFQDWLTRTNDMVNIFKTDAITASGSGDTTNGDATLVGDFTATNVIANTLLSTDDIAARSPSGTINFQSPFQVTGTSAITATFLYGASGGQIRFTDGTLSWDVGIEDSTDGNFIINTGVAPTKFELSPAGTLTVPNIVVSGTVTASNFVGAAQFDDTDDIPEGTTNLYFTTARARGAFSEGTNINIAGNGEISVEDVIDGTEFRVNGAAGASTAAYIDGTVVGGQPRGRMNVTFGGSSYEVGNWNPAGLSVSGDLGVSGGATFGSAVTVTGNIQATGNVITAFSSSDRALKENLTVIDDSLNKVMQVNGYTFNYIDGTDRVSGVVAQEIEAVLPEVVYDHQRNNGTYKAVRYEGIIPLLIEAIKELKDKVDELENRLDSSGT